MDDIIVTCVKTQLNATTCEVVSLPQGGIVNAGKAAVIKADEQQYFIKCNDTPLVRKFYFIYFHGISITTGGLRGVLHLIKSHYKLIITFLLILCLDMKTMDTFSYGVISIIFDISTFQNFHHYNRNAMEK